MAKKSMRARWKNREKLVLKYAEQRRGLKVELLAARCSADLTTTMEVLAKIAKLPLNSNPVRQSSRCLQCGRSRAVYKKFQLCRICLRQQLMTGNVTGGRKSSW